VALTHERTGVADEAVAIACLAPATQLSLVAPTSVTVTPLVSTPTHAYASQ